LNGRLTIGDVKILDRKKSRSVDDLKAVESIEVKKLAELRSSIKERIDRLETELDEWKTLLDVLDQRLAQVSFKKAEISPAPKVEKIKRVKPLRKPSKIEVKYEQAVPLKTTTGILLAELQIGSEALRVVPAKGVNLKTGIPPFESFLINRIFKEMLKRDEEDVKNNKLTPDTKFAYEVKEAEDGTIEEIRIKNYRTARRLREIRTSLRWTLEKMYEKLYSES